MHAGKDDSDIKPDDLPPEISGERPPGPLKDSGSDYLSLPLREAREAFEREYLLAQMERFDGNVSKTAQHVGMERSALHRKLKTLQAFSGDEAA